MPFFFRGSPISLIVSGMPKFRGDLAIMLHPFVRFSLSRASCLLLVAFGSMRAQGWARPAVSAHTPKRNHFPPLRFCDTRAPLSVQRFAPPSPRRGPKAGVWRILDFPSIGILRRVRPVGRPSFSKSISRGPPRGRRPLFFGTACSPFFVAVGMIRARCPEGLVRRTEPTGEPVGDRPAEPVAPGLVSS